MPKGPKGERRPADVIGNSAVRVAPAMAAGISDRLWDVADIVKLIEIHEGKL
jgi:hypothetical protein